MRVFRFASVLCVAAVTVMAGCGGSGNVVLTPQPSPRSTPSPAAGKTAGPSASATPSATATPSSTPSPGATSSAAIAAANTALTNVQTQYAALPHVSLSADLTTLASQMVASGKFATAVVSPGGISATLPNGLPALVFADHVGDTSLAAAAQRVALPPADDAARRPYETFEGAPETIAILVNNTDKSRAFNPAIQTIIANAITAAGFSGPQYGVDNGDVSLDTIAGVSAGGFVDVFDISTHGMAAIDNGGNSYYA